MTGRPRLLIVDAGVRADEVPDLAADAIVWLDADGPAGAMTAEPPKLAGIDRGGMARAAMSVSNRAAFAFVTALEQSSWGRALLAYGGVSLRSLVYSAVAEELFGPLRIFVVLRDTVRAMGPANVAFISGDPLHRRLWAVAAPAGAVHVAAGPSSDASRGAAVRMVARCVRDFVTRSGRSAPPAWTASSGQRRVLFVAGNARVCERRHPNVFAAITEAGIELAILCHRSLAGDLPVPHAFLDDVGVPRARQVAKLAHCRNAWRARRALLATLESVADGADGWKDVLRALAPAVVHRLVTHSLYVAVDLLEVLTASLTRLRPDAVLYDNRHMFGMCTTLAARRAGIPSIWAQDGVVGSEEPAIMAMEADRCLSWGEASWRYLGGTGVASDRVTVVGAPFVDTLLDRRFLDRHALGAALGLSLDASGPLVSYMSVYVNRESHGMLAFGLDPIGHKRAIIEAVCRSVAAVPGAKLLIKLHPSDPDREFDRGIASTVLSASRFAVTERQDVLYDVLRASDAVIVHDGSTTGVEAVTLERPLLGVDFHRVDGAGSNSWIAEGIALPVHAPDDMTPALQAALFDPATRARLAERRETFLRQWIHETDGKNCARLVSALQEMLG